MLLINRPSDVELVNRTSKGVMEIVRGFLFQ